MTAPSRLLIWPLLVLLSACASDPRQPTSEGWDTRSRNLAALQQWSFSGRVAVSTPDGADSARLKWRQDADDLEMTLSGPVGLKQATLQREDEELALLRDGQRIVLEAGQDPLLQEFGWSLPLDYLPWWLRGLPAPAPPATTEFEDGTLRQLEQAGWVIQYTEYQWVDGVQLPRRMRFQRDEVQGKLLLKNWTLAL